ncbi:CDP-glycerol glycerophosphotransferase family protein [Alphaproteobacteria bacterium]|nr:CDP-glycerol glycerophosphotransferase family protein [Alphaproteobacteria bacterium]
MLKNLFKSFQDYRRYINQSSKKEIIFFSEGLHHWAHLKFLIMSLIKEYKVTFITLNLNDAGLELKHKNYDSFFFGNLFILNLFFQKNNSKYLITSLPDLGKLYFKKNNNNCKFIYVFHSLASSHTQYYKDSFDNFDIILCSGPHHFNEIRKSENYYNNKRKTLYKYGYPRLEEISKSKYKIKQNNKKYILIAPSWGENSITNICLEEIIVNLILNNYQVIFRPHNMSLIKNKKTIKNLLKKFSNNNAFIFDNNNNSFETLLKADLMIADWGSTGSDFCLGLEKPVIYVDTPAKIKNQEFEHISKNAFEFEIRQQIGTVINLNNLSNLSKLVDQTLKNYNKDNFAEQKNNFLNNYVYNYLSSEFEGIKIMKKIMEK